MAKYLKQNDPYENLVVLHTHSIKKQQERFLYPMLGYEFLDGASLQIHSPDEVHELTEKWLKESKRSGRTWVASLDELGPADTGTKPDADDPEHNDIRAKVLGEI